MEPDALAFLRYQEDIFGVIRCLYLDQLIIFLQNNGLQSILAFSYSFTGVFLTMPPRVAINR